MVKGLTHAMLGFSLSQQLTMARSGCNAHKSVLWKAVNLHGYYFSLQLLIYSYRHFGI